MNSRTFDSERKLVAKPRFEARAIDRLAKRAVLARLARLAHGRIVLNDNGERLVFGDANADFPVQATIDVLSPAFYSDVAFGGSVGAGEAYIRGLWRCTQIDSLVRILLRNRDVLDTMESGLALLTRPLQKAFHWFNRNTRSGSRRNIAAHYDLGNAFYELWLDSTMMYSCGFYERDQSTLEEASIAKLDRICRRLRLGPGDHVIEIGTGWGGFAIHAASRYGCRVTTTTISREQYEFARARVESLGLQDRITLLFSDYRDLEGQYDKLVSIEMIEAVGHQYLDTYFRKCADLLKPDGEMLIQAITIADQRYDAARKTVDFIKRYVFPGGFLPSVTAMTDSMTRKTDLRAVMIDDIGPHYARTLRHWRERFFARIDDIRGLGYSDEFIRLWEFYLCYCEGAFVERAIGDVHLHAIKPLARPN